MSNSIRVIRLGLAATLVVGGISIADDARELTWDDLIPDAATIEQPADSELRAEEEPVDVVERDGQGPVDHGSGEDDLLEEAFSWPGYPTGVVEELNGALVKLPGFVVPLEVSEEGKVSEFLLVPYFGACIHFPPPPANQIVYITAKEPIDLESTWEPIWATGELKTEFRDTDLAYAGYTMAVQTTEVYEY